MCSVPKGLKWRWQAMTSDRSYAEIVLANSVICSVDEVLLIHRETGLLLVHASRDPQHARDADLVSSMLTAIEDFARDSFDLDDEDSLSSFSMGGSDSANSDQSPDANCGSDNWESDVKGE